MHFGEKEVFAIEIIGEKLLTYLPVRLWLSGVPIGTLDDSTYIPTFANRIHRATEPPKEMFPDVESAERYGMSYVLSDECKNNGRYFTGLGDAFDDFTILRYPHNNDIVLLWKLTESPHFSYMGITSGEERKCIVSKEIVRRVTYSFLESVISDKH